MRNRIVLMLISVGSSLYGADFTLTKYGPANVYAGYQAYERVTIDWTGYDAGTNKIYIFNSITPSDPKITASAFCYYALPNCYTQAGTGRKWNGYGSGTVARPEIRIGAAADATPGNYTVDVEIEMFCGNSIAECPAAHDTGAVWKTISIPITVLAVPTLTTTPLPTAAPTLAGLELWEQTATYIGDNFCTWHPETPCFNSAVCNQVWFYDGAKIYADLAAYFSGDATKWNACSTFVASPYADYINANPTAVNGYSRFPLGIGKAYDISGAGKYSTAGQYLANDAYGGGITDYSIRETAYDLESYIESDQRWGTDHSTVISWAVNYLVGHFDVYFVQQTGYMNLQTFMTGSAAAALAKWYEYSKTFGHFDNTGTKVAGVDARIPWVVKSMLDWAWANTNASYQLVLNPLAQTQTTPACAIEQFGCCQYGCQTAAPELQALTLHAFGWYYALTGDDTYRVKGDLLFGATPRNVRGTVSATTDRVTVTGHGWGDGTAVKWYTDLGGEAFPAATPGTIYSNQTVYVVNGDTNTFQVSRTLGGAVVDILTGGTVFVMPATDYYLPTAGKIYSQNFKYTFDYLSYRSTTGLGGGGVDRGTMSGTFKMSGTGRVK